MAPVATFMLEDAVARAVMPFDYGMVGLVIGGGRSVAYDTRTNRFQNGFVPQVLRRSTLHRCGLTGLGLINPFFHLSIGPCPGWVDASQPGADRIGVSLGWMLIASPGIKTSSRRPVARSPYFGRCLGQEPYRKSWLSVQTSRGVEEAFPVRSKALRDEPLQTAFRSFSTQRGEEVLAANLPDERTSELSSAFTIWRWMAPGRDLPLLLLLLLSPLTTPPPAARTPNLYYLSLEVGRVRTFLSREGFGICDQMLPPDLTSLSTKFSFLHRIDTNLPTPAPTGSKRAVRFPDRTHSFPTR
ncbi:NADH:ubiquinone dehydrogenase subunit 1 [Datura stramonium]|uniref:NADH:ubiquinone dehydrogenase subunit 1 n=1 Tax=Datura stramonium TaxID=4076 RepID=A0ABS8W1U9_DATST|nr:NADH:ubiquinone dehydrogenase subunit 1 [Datura stramonium]